MADLPSHDVTAGGERVSPDDANALFVAHRSIYAFAARYAAGRHVLDAGCGTGYGATLLAEAGATTVLGVDVDAGALDYARRTARGPNVSFAAADLAEIGRLPPPAGGWGLVVCSNALEHVWGVDAFLRGVWQGLAPDGVVVVAVPGVFDAASRVLQMSNRYHLNIWSPEQWRHALQRWFADVAPLRHILTRADLAFDPGLDAASVGLDDADFAFPLVLDGDLRGPTLTHVFVARAPRAASDVPPRGAPMAFIDDSFSRRPPHLTPLPPDEAVAGEPRSAARLPAAALRLWRARGAAALAAEARRSVVWRLRRRYALRLLRRGARGR